MVVAFASWFANIAVYVYSVYIFIAPIALGLLERFFRHGHCTRVLDWRMRDSEYISQQYQHILHTCYRLHTPHTNAHWLVSLERSASQWRYLSAHVCAGGPFFIPYAFLN